MDTKEIQELVDKWVNQPQHKVAYFPPFEMLAQLQEELGEVAKEISHIHGFKKKKTSEITDGLKTEIGDLFFSLVCLSNFHGIDLSEAFQKSLNKKEHRDKNRFT